MQTVRSFAVGLALGIAALGLAGCGESKAKFNAMDVTGAPWGQTYSLPDLTGQVRTPADFPGKITAVFLALCTAPMPAPLT